MRKITLILFLSIMFFNAPVSAGTDGEISLSKKNQPEKVKDCFEKLNRGIFAFNQALDDAIFEPLARGYRHIPSPIRSGASNVLNNLSNLVTIPNNLLQGDFTKAGANTGRFVIKVGSDSKVGKRDLLLIAYDGQKFLLKTAFEIV